MYASFYLTFINIINAITLIIYDQNIKLKASLPAYSLFPLKAIFNFKSAHCLIELTFSKLK